MQTEHIYQELFEAVQEGTVESVQKAASRIFESAVSVTDTSFRVLAADDDPGATDAMLVRDGGHVYVSEDLLALCREHNLIANLTAKPHETIPVDWDFFMDHPHITTGIFWDKHILGSVTVNVDSADFTPEQDRALQATADALALVMHTYASGKKILRADRDQFTSKLFHGMVKEADLQKASENRYFNPGGRYLVLATDFSPEHEFRDRIRNDSHLLFYRESGIAYLLANTQSKELKALEERIANRGYRYGLSTTFTEFLLTERMAKQAAAALDFGNQSGKEQAEWAFQDHVLDMLLQRNGGEVDFIHPAILEMEAYDAQNNTEYLRTLRTWLQQKMDYSATAKVMHLHRNSLYYRMQRIRDLFFLDLEDMDTDVQLYLSLNANRE